MENVTNVAKQTKILNMIGELSWREYINPSYLPPSCVVKLPLKQSFYVMHAYQILSRDKADIFDGKFPYFGGKIGFARFLRVLVSDTYFTDTEE